MTDPTFRELAGPEIAQFNRELVERTGDAQAGDKIYDQDLLREVMGRTMPSKSRSGASRR